jgi:hypothetical protein
LELNRRFYQEVVAPILGSRFSDLPHAAALIGYGSDVLGFDTPMSTDHNWGPRLQLFLRPEDHQQHSAAIDKVLRQELPITFLGYPVNFGEPDWSDGGTQRMEPVSVGPVRHMIELVTVDEYFHKCLGVDPEEAPDAIGWLTLAEQALLEMTSGEVFHDGLGDLTAARARLAYYPRDVWLVRMAAQWKRIAQEEAFVGRCGDAGDDLGSRIVAARLVRELMRLAFLLERRYAPYSKWLGTAFARLACAPRLSPLFEAVLAGGDWQARQQPLAEAYELMARMHNALGVTPPVDPRPRLFFNRPFLVLFADRFVDALGDAVEDEALRTLPPIGGVDQFADCTDLTEQPLLLQRLRVLYNAPGS